ncbi:MAG TPA: DUF4183 domain-containing protein [Clostridiaceae bacterium]|nr:DUF4183 domain-containing protein [Clostridiaceae bacterium]
MATLFKLAITAQTTTTVTTKPAVKKYFYLMDPQHLDQGTLTIPAAAFVDEQENPVVNITLVTPDNGYYLLFINGVLQPETLYTVEANQVIITDAGTVPIDATITLIVTNFAPEADSTTTVET